MLRDLNALEGYVLKATDGEIGRCKDFLFDDERWTVRYMVADTGKWLPKRKVLISPISLGRPDWGSKRFPVHLTRKMVEESPHIDSDAPVSREHERRWFEHYGYAMYWAGTGIWGAGAYPAGLLSKEEREKMPVEQSGPDPAEKPLRSADEVEGYTVRARDGDIGSVKDFIVDDETWAIRYLVVDTGSWLPGRKVLIAPYWIASVDWAGQKVEIDMTRDAVERSPEYDPSEPVNREYETRLYDFYGRPTYW